MSELSVVQNGDLQPGKGSLKGLLFEASEENTLSPQYQYVLLNL